MRRALSVASARLLTDIFAHESVLQIGQARLAQAVVNALRLARMRVLPHHMKWVLELIGPEQAALCTSLPGSVRIAR